MNIINIINAFAKKLSLSKTTEEDMQIARERFGVCSSCPNIGYDSSMNFVGKQLIEEIGDTYCKKCTCPLDSKLIVKNETCPENRWT